MMPVVTSLAIVVFVLCAAVSVPRFRAARHGRNVRMSVAASLLLTGLALAIEPVYNAVDPLLGGRNITNAISHALVFSPAFYALGAQVLASVRTKRRLRLLAGPVGMWVAAVGTIGTVGTFWLMDTPRTSQGLADYQDDPFYGAYWAASLLYVAWACTLMIGPCWRAAREWERPRAHRIGYRFLASGFALALPLPVFYLLSGNTQWTDVAREVSLYGSIVAVAIGVTAAAFKPSRPTNPLAPLRQMAQR